MSCGDATKAHTVCCSLPSASVIVAATAMVVAIKHATMKRRNAVWCTEELTEDRVYSIECSKTEINNNRKNYTHKSKTKYDAQNEK